MAESKRSMGTVKWFSAQKGFGFIASDDGGEDLFVHHTSIQSDGFRTLSEGQPVEFSAIYGSDGRNSAVDVIPRYRRGGGRGGGRGFYGGRGRGGRGGYISGGRGDGGGYGRGGSGERSGGGVSSGGACYNCGRYGHLARDCYQGGGGGGGGGRGGRRFGGGGGGGGGGGNSACYNCGEEGHFARDCPNPDQN